MKELINILIPQKLRFFSVGSTFGIVFGLFLSLLLSTWLVQLMLFVFVVASAIGFYNIKDEFIEHLK